MLWPLLVILLRGPKKLSTEARGRTRVFFLYLFSKKLLGQSATKADSLISRGVQPCVSRALLPAIPYPATCYPVSGYLLSRALLPAIPYPATCYPVPFYLLSRALLPAIPYTATRYTVPFISLCC